MTRLADLPLPALPALHELGSRFASGVLPPEPRVLLRDRVYAQLQEAIVTGVLAPGSRLRDVDVAEALEISRTPVREALRRLEDEGLVETSANRWTRVAPVDVERAIAIYPMVGALEALAIRLAPVPDTVRLAHLTELNEGLAAALARREPLAASESDAAFHRALVVPSANEELIQSLAELKLRLRRVEILYFDGTSAVTESVEEHRRAVAALAGGDRDAAAEAIVRNWDESLKRLRSDPARFR